jgi:hypothetical protein
MYKALHSAGGDPSMPCRSVCTLHLIDNIARMHISGNITSRPILVIRQKEIPDTRMPPRMILRL